jgi:UDP:flavonoid glycosyltransferase YjiC (YdhE family)
MTLRRLAAPLLQRGWNVVAGLSNCSDAHLLAEIGVTVVQAPIWQPNGPPTESSVSWADILADMGLRDQHAIQLVIKGWEQLILQFRPAIVVCEMALGLALAAKGRVPSIVAGNGYTLPPPQMKAFPPLHTRSARVWREDQLLENVNAALRWAGLPQRPTLPAIYHADAHIVFSFPILDPYRQQRQSGVVGPLFDAAPAKAKRPGERTLVYLSKGLPVRPQVLAALARAASCLRVVAPSLSRHEKHKLAALGARVEETAISILSALSSASLVVHLGSHNVASEALAAGVPQLVLSVDIEKHLIGAALQKAGVAHWVESHHPQPQIAPDLISRLCSDHPFARRAELAGRQHRRYLAAHDPLGHFEREFMRLVA